MNEQQFTQFSGALEHKEDKRDYTFIGQLGMFDWSKGFNIEDKVGIIPPKNQFSSYSCGGQAWAYYMSVLEALANNRLYDENSAKFIYGQTHVGNGGSDGRTNCELCKKKGSSSEALCRSYKSDGTTDEQFMIRAEDISPQAYQDALNEKALYYGNVIRTDIDAIASAIQNNGGVVLGVYGENNGTWLSADPKYPTGSGKWAHWVYAGKVVMRNGKKCIGILNSWGNIGEKGWQYLDESYFTSGNIFVVWTMTYDKTNFVIPPPIYNSKGEVMNWYQRWIAILKKDLWSKWK